MAIFWTGKVNSIGAESEITMLRLRLLEMEKQQIGPTPEQPRRFHSGDAAFSRYSGSGNDRRFWGMYVHRDLLLLNNELIY